MYVDSHSLGQLALASKRTDSYCKTAFISRVAYRAAHLFAQRMRFLDMQNNGKTNTIGAHKSAIIKIKHLFLHASKIVVAVVVL